MKVKKADDIFETKSVKSHRREASVPVQMSKPVSTGISSIQFPLNKMGTIAGKPKNGCKLVDNNDGEFLEYQNQPHLRAYVDRGMGKRFRKRLQFSIEKEEDILSEQNQKMVQDEHERLLSKVDTIMEERKKNRENRDRMVQDTLASQNEQFLKKCEFIEVNDKLKEDKKGLSDMAYKNKHKDKLSYFPFTHGEQIEMQRKEIKAQTKVYLTEIHEAKEKAKAEVKASQLSKYK